MADVFISYKRRLRPRIVELAGALEQLKVSVWFDAEIEPGKSFGAVINRELADARCVLVCWTPDAFAPEHGDEISWVEAEATKGRERKILVPVLLEQTMLNAPWNMLQTENLIEWTPEVAPTGAWLGVLAGIGKLVDRPGLADYVRASAGSADDLTRWAQAYPSDPLADGIWERITEIEVAAAKERVKQRQSGAPPPPAPSQPRPAPPPPQPSPQSPPPAGASAKPLHRLVAVARVVLLGVLFTFGGIYLFVGLTNISSPYSGGAALAVAVVSGAVLILAWYLARRWRSPPKA